MTNRYTQLSFNSLNDLPQLQLPYQELDNLLGQQQSKIDLLNASADLTPKYIQQSEDDRNLAGQIIKYQQDVKAQLAEIAKTGNVNAYMEGLSQAQSQIKKLYSPGGAADVLQQRYNQDVEEKKKLAEFYKEKPDWANYELANRKYNKVGYNPQTGEYNPINTFGNVIKYISSKEIDELANRNIDNIKDSVLYDKDGRERKGIDKYALDRVQSIYDLQTVKGVTYDRVVSALASVLPQEYIQSIYHQSDVDRYYNPNIPELDKQIFKEDDKGELKLNLNNPVGKLLHGYATGAARQEITHHTGKFENILGIKNYESQLRQKEQEEANKTAIVPIMPANKAVPKDVQYYVKNGKLKKNTNASADITDAIAKDFAEQRALGNGNSVALWIAEKIMNTNSFFDRLFTEDDDADLSDPTLNNIKEHLAAQNPNFNKLSPSAQMEEMVREIDKQGKESLGGNFNANLNSKMKENFDKIFGAVSYDKDGNLEYDPGLLPNLKVTTREGKIESGQKFLDEVKEGEYGDGAGLSYKGTIDDYTSPLPYGTIVMGVGNTEVYIEPDVASTNKDEALYNGVYRSMINAGIGNVSNFKYKGSDYTSMYKPDGTVQLTNKQTKQTDLYIPQYDEFNQFTGLKKK